MARALQIFQGGFGRAALLDMNHSLVLHAHPHCHVLIKVAGADTAFNVDGRSCPLGEDCFVVVNAWEPHSYTHRPSKEGTVILALYIEPDWLRQIESAFGASAEPGFFPVPSVGMTAQVARAARHLTLAMSFEGDHAEMLGALDTLMTAVIERFAEWRNASSRRAPYRDFRVRKAIGYMRENLGGHFTLCDVARESGLSRSHLFQLFHENLNLSPNVYYNTLRMEAAVGHLADTQARPLGELSRGLGFAMPSHFTRFFRTNMGVTPSEYRRVVTLPAEATA